MSQAGEQLDHIIESLLDDCRRRDRYRSPRLMRPLDATHVEIERRQYVNFCSNNYLGLTFDPRLAAAAQVAARAGGTGSGAAALVCGYSPIHASAERALADWKQTQAAVLLPSGYQANHAVVQTLAAINGKQRRVRFLLDKLIHASILDAVLGSGLPARIFPHNNLSKLSRLLADSSQEDLNVVATESIFSMDGDAADLPGLARLKAEHAFVLLLDEAHASGIYGPSGAGYAHELGLHRIVDINVVTLSKALGAVGGAICASRAFCQGVVNFGRAFIYSTSLPPPAAAAVEAAIQILRDEPSRRERLRALSRRVRQALGQASIALPPGDSPIIRVIMGAESEALNAAELIRGEGMLVAAIRPPTVAPGTSRLRATLCSEHTDDEVSQLIGVLKRTCSPRRQSIQPPELALPRPAESSG